MYIRVLIFVIIFTASSATWRRSSGPSTSSNNSQSCPACGSRTLKRSHRLESIKNEILRKLRMTSPPNVTGIRMPNLPHLQMIIDRVQMESQHAADQSENELATTMTIFRVSQSSPFDPESTTVYFDLNSNELRYPNQVVNAIFYIYIRKLSDPNPDWQSYVLVYKGYTQNSGQLLFRNKITYQQTGQWMFFNITSVVQDWIRNNASNRGLEILCIDNSGQSLALTRPLNDEEASNKSYLHMDIVEANSRRRKRNVDYGKNCEEYSSELDCCRYPLEVNFQEFGWDWIIIPKTYSAYYCSGDCPLPVRDPSLHTHVTQDKYKGMCCAPKSTSSISMLYYDERMNIVYGRIPGMTVNNCSCF